MAHAASARAARSLIRVSRERTRISPVARYPGVEPLPCPTFEDAFAAVRDGKRRARHEFDREFGGRPGCGYPPSDAEVGTAHRSGAVHAGASSAYGAQRRQPENHQDGREPRPRARPMPQHHPQAAASRRSSPPTPPAPRGKSPRPATTPAPHSRPGSPPNLRLRILQDNVEDEKHNTTRFVVLSRAPKWASRTKST